MECKEITSQGNTRIKWLKKLAQKKYRRQNQEFTVENLTTIYDALASGYDFKDLIVTQDFIHRNTGKFAYLQETSQLKSYYLIDDDLNKFYSQLDTPSGITAVYDINPSDIDLNQSCLYINGIKDPGNMGTIMRTALAFDTPNIVLDPTCVDVYNSKVINAAKDSIFKLNILENQSVEWIANIKGQVPICVADAQNGRPLSQINSAQPYCLVLGSESHGVSDEIIQLADQHIRIDISDQIDSLNVSAAAAILLHGLKLVSSK